MKPKHLLSSLAFLAFMPFAEAQFILTLQLENMQSYQGQSVTIRVSEAPGIGEVARKVLTEFDTISHATVDFYALFAGREYEVDIHADVSGNGSYDPPPTDHAWRRILTGITGNTMLIFQPDTMYEDVALTDPFPFSQYDGKWGGKWFNQTFSTTDSIQATIELGCDSVRGMVVTSGAFGSPDTLRLNFSQAAPDNNYDPVTDTVRLPAPAPFMGEIMFVNGDLMGDLSTGGVGLSFIGTVGRYQTVGHYEITSFGVPFANGYFYMRELMVNSSVPRIVMHASISDINCAGEMNGAIGASPAGGVGPFSYAWSTGDSVSFIMNLAAGNYSITVVDTDGCTADDTFTISEPLPVAIESNITDPTCNGDCDGAIDVTVSGGTPPYQYAWSNGESTEDISMLCDGEYSVTVTDMNGCTQVQTFIVNRPFILFSETDILHVPCFGLCNGGIDLMVAGGTPPYTYLWNTGQTAEDLASLCAGEYVVTVTDDAGCTTTRVTMVTQPDSLKVDSMHVVHPSGGMNNGVVTVFASGGVPPLMYSRFESGAYSPSNVFENLPVGARCFFVRDANDCLAKSDTIVLENVTSVVDPDIHIAWYPNPAHDFIQVVTDVSVEISISDLTGRIVIPKQILNGEVVPLPIPSGLYLVHFSTGDKTVTRKLVKY